ncbi:MAG: DinB family protein [Acidobacteria bacterium]|nr:DinB family protein [Acidobacteriota bacterium]MCA1608006.1 DinB family protein [Acidobacteriota bacterium]
MAINKAFIKEIEQEAVATRKMLERIPAETFDWKPHEKSMSMKQLAGLVAGMFGWFSMMTDDDELDFAKPFDRPEVRSTKDLTDILDNSLVRGVSSLKNADDSVFGQSWKLRTGDAIHMELPKGEVIRQSINHLAHHRGQLSVYMRLKDIPVPSIYGPTADEPQF